MNNFISLFAITVLEQEVSHDDKHRSVETIAKHAETEGFNLPVFHEEMWL